ncbi:MAG: family 43 glycosylhydrolase [Pricia sp.]
MTKKLLFATFSLFLIATVLNAQIESIKNGVLWRDTDGNRIQAHGTDILKHDGRYYMIGEDRTTEFRSYQGINLYVSDDLMNWKFLNKIVDENTNEQMGNPNLPRDERRFTERPNLIYNEQTQKFVIWSKYQNPGFTANEVALFISDTIDGDYTFVKAFQPSGFDTNDCSFFRDDDGKVYYITTHKGANTPNDPTDDGSLNLYELSDDYLDVKGDPTFLLTGQNKEAPVIFKKDGLYYLLTSNKSGWTPNHGQYYTSTSLTSGWSAPKKYFNKLTYDTQPTDVITITDTFGSPSYFYVGDRWWDPRLPESKTIILPMTVDAANASLRLQFVPELKIDVETGDWTPFDDNTYVPQEGWELISVSSEETSQTNNPATNAFDNDLSTIWHTRYSSGQDSQPHEMVVDLGAEYPVSGFTYIPRQDTSPNGIVENFQLFLSDDGEDWGTPVASGALGYWNEVYFRESTSRFMKFVSRSTVYNTPARFTTAAEFQLMTSTEYDSEFVTINPYYKIDNNSFMTGSEIFINEGSTLILGPQATFRGIQSPFFGSFSWSGPNEFYASERGITLDSIQTNQFGDYTFHYLDDRYNMHTKIMSVIPAANRPSVSFADATGDRTLVEGYNLHVDVDASDTDGSVENVSLYINDSLVRQIDESPYRWGYGDSSDPDELNGLSPGSYTFKAMVTDNDGYTNEETFILTVRQREEGDICYFDTPRSTGLSKIERNSYQHAYVFGSGGPAFENFRKFSIRWKPKTNGLYKFAINTDDGNPAYYVDLRSKTTYQLKDARPELTIADSGIEGLDGGYWLTMDDKNFVMVSKRGDFAIYFSNSSNVPSCNFDTDESDTLVAEAGPGAKMTLHPNPVQNQLSIELEEMGLGDYQVYDMYGRLLDLSIISNEGARLILDVETLRPGTYIFKIGKGNSSVSKLFIKD